MGSHKLSSHNDCLAGSDVIVCNAAMAKDDAQAAERRRRALADFIEARGLEVASWAREAGLRQPNGIYNFLRGETSSLAAQTYLALAKAAGVTTAHLTGELLTPVDTKGLPRIKVIGAVEAGAWREALAWPANEQIEIAIPVATGYEKKAFALRVNGPSMNLIYPDGTLIICINFYEYNGALQNGDRVVVYRTSADGHIEATVKELVSDENGRKWLWPRSSDPQHQQPIELVESAAKKRGTAPEVVIHAVVIGSYRPERTAPLKR